MANARLGWFSPLGLAASIRASAFRFGDSPRRVGLRAHCFRFSARAASEIALGGLAFGLTASVFRHAPIRGCHSAGWPSGSPLPLFGTHRFGDCRWASWPSGSLLPIFGTRRFGVAAGRLAFGLIASEIAIWRVGLWAHRFGNSARRVGLRAHCFRFSARTASEIALGGLILPLGGWSSDSLLPIFGMRRSAPPRRRREDRRSTTTRQLFHFKTLIPTC